MFELLANKLNKSDVWFFATGYTEGEGFGFQNIYSAGQYLNNLYTDILSVVSNLLLQNKNFNIFENGKEFRNFVYIDDVVNYISFI